MECQVPFTCEGRKRKDALHSLFDRFPNKVRIRKRPIPRLQDTLQDPIFVVCCAALSVRGVGRSGEDAVVQRLL
jgi:hypothetical protein